MFLRTAVIVFIAVIGVIHSQDLGIHESLDSNNVVDTKYRPWKHDNTSKNWISLEGMGVGSINSVIRLHVPDLRWLVVDDNRISKIPTEAFKFLPDLTYISLAGNEINEFEFDAFKRIEKVQVVDLDRNPIGNNLDSSVVFSSLPALERLYLRSCSLPYFDVPKHMENLSRLYLSGNQLNNFQASSDSALTHIYLDSNQIVYVSLSHFKSLIYLDLSNNWLSEIVLNSEVSPDYYSGRDWPYYQEYSSRLSLNLVPSLQYLIVADNRISKIEADTFIGAESLVHINLTGNKLSQVEAGTFNNMLQLEDILLDSNEITKLNYRAFVNLPNVKIISLKNNQISDVDEDAFTRLNSSANDVYLFLDNNRIHTLRRRMFAGIKGLKHIGLSNNRIKIISSHAFVNLPNLESLFIEHQSRDETSVRYAWGYEPEAIARTDRVIESHAFFNLSKLTLIKIVGNVFTDIEAQAFHTLPKLTLLNLANNAIEHLSSEAFYDLPGIEELNLRENLLSEIKPETFPKHLKRLNLAWNNVCPDFSCWNVGELRQLEELDISGITERLWIDDFTGFPKNLSLVMERVKATST